jgi:hypothetical protein
VQNGLSCSWQTKKTRSVTESVQVLKGGKEQESAQCALSTEYHRHQVDKDEMSNG